MLRRWWFQTPAASDIPQGVLEVWAKDHLVEWVVGSPSARLSDKRSPMMDEFSEEVFPWVLCRFTPTAGVRTDDFFSLSLSSVREASRAPRCVFRHLTIDDEAHS